MRLSIVRLVGDQVREEGDGVCGREGDGVRGGAAVGGEVGEEEVVVVGEVGRCGGEVAVGGEGGVEEEDGFGGGGGGVEGEEV